MKNIFSTRALVATAIGAALFALAFIYIKVPSPIPSTQIQTAYGIAGLFAALFGPICAALMAFIGHALNDILFYGSAWWSWIIASGVCGLIMGIAYFVLDVENGRFNLKDVITFNVIQVIANVIAWGVVAPGLDVLIYSEPANLVFAQSVFSIISNALSTGIIGTLLIFAYAKTRTASGSLRKK